ncbi:hypothetical protein E4P35_13740, partial [Thiopseudomonas sp. 4R-3cl]
MLAFEAVKPIGDPVLELAELAAEVRATVRALGQRVNALQDPRYVSPLGTEQTRAELALFGQYQDRLARMLTTLGQLGLDERRVKLDEAQAAVLVQVLDRLGQVPGSGVTVFEVVGGLYLSGLQGRHHLRAHHGLLLRGQGLT